MSMRCRRSIPWSTPFRCALGAALPCALGACTGQLNRHDGLLCDDLPALRASAPTPATPERVDAPSLATEETPWSSRGGWQVVTVRIPGAVVETQPAYRTAIAATQPGSPTQVATAPAHAAVDLVLLGPRMIATPPGTTVRAPKAADGSEAAP